VRCGIAVAVLTALLLAAPAGAAEPRLRAGVGQADVTPPQTGYYLGGWTRADRRALGQQTRLWAKAMVLERGGRKVALVAVELFMVPAGLQQQVADGLRDRGFDVSDVVISATHTHSGPGGYAPFPSYNTAAPSPATISDPASFVELLNPRPADRQLYTFLVRQITAAIRDADDDLAPAVAGWGAGTLVGLTRNRSLEAHLADHGILLEPGKGTPAQDPDGPVHTIDPAVDVLRVDKVRGKRRIPIGAWSQFADHGTVVKSELQAYSGDHHAAAHRVFEAAVRKRGRVPRGQLVLNVYGNGDEGDQSAGMDHTGPAGADEVGRAEAAAMLRAWRAARPRLSARPVLDLRWTRLCFCGAATEGGRVARTGRPGVPFFTGSEEGRGPLYDLTGQSFEGRRSLIDGFDSQGHKLVVPAGEFPSAVPLAVVRIGDRVIATLPGEPTKEVGARVKRAVAAAAGVPRVVIAGLTNEYISYITTPEEYERQHYEGGSTLFGPRESNLLRAGLVTLASRLASGAPAPAPAAFDPTNGVRPDGPPYPAGAATGTLLAQPAAVVPRLGHAAVAWQGGPSGHDRPVGRPFVTVQRRVKRRWRAVDSDLGLRMLWRVDANGRHDAYWEVPLTAQRGRYRLVVTATRYRLASQPFVVTAARSLTVEAAPARPGRVAVRLRYPAPRENVDLTARPRQAAGGVVRFVVDGRPVIVRHRRAAVFSVAAGRSVVVPAGAARDRAGNRNGAELVLRR
jgi:neutral ceramidase